MNRLRQASVLFLDCQASGPDPVRHHLLEIAWRRCDAGALGAPAEYRLRLPEGVVLPPRVRRLTGLDEALLADGLTAEAVAHALRQALTGVEALLIHYARFERPYLHALLGAELPPLCCTHELARRMLPGLPGYGLAALAGYFGAFLEQHHRAAAHVAATAAVFDGLLPLLEAAGIDDWPALAELLSRARPLPGQRRCYALPRERRLALPVAPGVYRYLGRDGRVLYVGKAGSLQQRVNSYFRSRRTRQDRHRELLTQAVDVDVTVCPSATHAALLECREIQRLDPPCNTALRPSGRQLAFLGRDLLRCAAHWSVETSVGPLPGPWLVERWQTLCRALLEGDAAAPLFRRPVAPAVLQAGIARFRAELPAAALCGRRALLACGLRWLRGAAEELVDETEAAPPRGETPSVEEVVQRCRDLLVLVARYWQRARRLARLWQVTVVWEEGGVPQQLRLDELAPAPVRGGGWDWSVEAYDLARVLLSELERLQRGGVRVRRQA
ncbi:MAG TPA: exonuclease domain-containing protein [Candidatus Competibacteraceae bacterium]|nr:exonuclease domain-containing protein [Candidatus Competibacteraceae bacterium]